MIKKIFFIVFFAFQLVIAQTQVEPIRILIFSAPFGSGHDAAAARIRETLETHYTKNGQPVNIIVKNTLDFAPKWITNFALMQFSKLQGEMPIVYSYFFENYMNQALKVEHAGQLTLAQNLLVSQKSVDRYIVADAFSGHPADVVFSTWPGSTELIIQLRHNANSLLAQHSPKIPLAHVQTDNAENERYFQLFAKDNKGNVGADMVFVPSREVYDAYRAAGIENMQLTGMPVILKGDLPIPEKRQEEKETARLALGLEPNAKTLMIEAGKNGAANYAVMIFSIAKQFKTEPINVIAGCGQNSQYLKLIETLIKGAKSGTPEFKALLKEMKELYQPRNIKKFMKQGTAAFKNAPAVSKEEVIRFIENGIPQNVKVIARGFVPLEPLRSASDIIITKPGGLSTSELGAQGRPMIILQEYASGEALPNGPLFERKGLAVISPDIVYVGRESYEMLNDPVRLQKMYAASAEFRKSFQLSRVVDYVTGFLAQRPVKAVQADSVKVVPHQESVLKRLVRSCLSVVGKN